MSSREGALQYNVQKELHESLPTVRNNQLALAGMLATSSKMYHTLSTCSVHACTVPGDLHTHHWDHVGHTITRVNHRPCQSSLTNLTRGPRGCQCQHSLCVCVELEYMYIVTMNYSCIVNVCLYVVLQVHVLATRLSMHTHKGQKTTQTESEHCKNKH